MFCEEPGFIWSGRWVRSQFPCVIEAAEGPVRIWALPYADPPEVAQVLEDPSIRGHEAAMAALLRSSHPGRNRGERNVVMGHAFVTGGQESESERPLSVGGSGEVSMALFQDFDYVALGHLHRPQAVGEERVRYAGSLLKYSFQEADHRKSVSVVELDRGGQIRVDEVELHPRRDVRRVRGTLAELLAAPRTPSSKDYLWIDLADDTPVYNALERLRMVYPNVLHAAREQSESDGGSRGPGLDNVRRLGVDELFLMFYRDVTGEDLDSAHQAVFTELVREFEQERRRV